jgi:hypothetical protein
MPPGVVSPISAGGSERRIGPPIGFKEDAQNSAEKGRLSPRFRSMRSTELVQGDAIQAGAMLTGIKLRAERIGRAVTKTE